MLHLRENLSGLQDEAADRIQAWFAACRDQDVFLTTSFVDPQVDRGKPAPETGLLTS